jgi:restriction system protein
MIAGISSFGQIVLPLMFSIAAIISGISTVRNKQTYSFGNVPETNAYHPHVNSSQLFPLVGNDPQEPLPRLEFPPKVPVVWTDGILQMIEWKRFETVTKEFLNMTGYVAQETKTGADGGVDISVTKQSDNAFRGIVQCKAWNAYRVGVKPVRELYGVMAAEKVKYGMLITSGTFTAEAEEFAKGKITLVSGGKFLEYIRKLPEEKKIRLLNAALEGDYSTPTCPQCDIKMTLRENKTGKNVGSKFWGCVRYPRCKQTLVFKE